MPGRTYIDGTTVLLFIKRVNKPAGADTAFRAIACLDGNQFTGKRDKKVVNNKCSGGWEDGISGKGSWTMQGSGQAITDTTSAEANYQELSAIWNAGESIEIKMANADGSYYRGGTALITDFSEDAKADEALSFSATFSGNGAPIIIKP